MSRGARTARPIERWPPGRDGVWGRDSISVLRLLPGLSAPCPHSGSTVDTVSIHERAARLLVGILTIGTAIPLMLTSHFGVAPFDVLTTGVAHTGRFNLGIAIVAMNVVFIAVAVLLGQFPGVGTVIGAFLVGPVIAVVLVLLPVPTTLAVQVVYLAAGIVTISIGVSFIISSGLGPGASELVMLGLMRHGIPIRWARTAVEIVSVIAGFALGGSLGIGTLVFALSIGHLLAALIPRVKGLTLRRSVRGVVVAA